MTFSLYDATVANYLQTLGAVSHFMEKSRTHFEKAGTDLGDIVTTRLANDMLPLRFQIDSVVQHSRGAIQAARTGQFFPPTRSDLDYAGLQKLVADARAELASLTREDVNALLGRDVIFKLNADMTLPFTAEGFLMSFSLPNFYFHASTAYGILRHKGAPLGKRDFMGRLILKS